MRIAYLSESLPPNTDGVSHTLVQISHYLEAEDIEYTFLSPFKPDNTHFLHNRVRKVKSLPFPMYSAYRVSLPLFDNIFKYLDGFEPDIIHITSPTPLCYHGIRYAHDRGIPVVSTYHTHFPSYLKYYGFDWFETFGWTILRWFYNKCDKTFVPSESIVEELQMQGINNTAHLPHGIDTEKFAPDYRNNLLRTSIDAEDKPILLFVGRLVKEKDLDDLIEVNHILQDRNLDFKQVFVGSGPFHEQLENALPDAYFTGTLGGDLLSGWYASSDIFVFPSTTETFGLVVQEAFSSGVPVVGVKSGGVKNLIKDGVNGYLAEPNNVEDIADKVATLIENQELRENLGTMARKKVLDRSWDNVNAQLLELYSELIGLSPADDISSLAEAEEEELVPTDTF
mgnify:CR=1 FL=1